MLLQIDPIYPRRSSLVKDQHLIHITMGLRTGLAGAEYNYRFFERLFWGVQAGSAFHINYNLLPATPSPKGRGLNLNELMYLQRRIGRTRTSQHISTFDFLKREPEVDEEVRNYKDVGLSFGR